MGKTKYLSAFERGMVVGARCTGLSVSRTATLVGFLPSTVSRVDQEWSSTQRTSSLLDTTVGNIGVNMGQRPYGMLSTPCNSMPRRIEAVAEGNIRKVFPMFGVLSVYCSDVVVCVKVHCEMLIFHEIQSILVKDDNLLLVTFALDAFKDVKTRKVLLCGDDSSLFVVPYCFMQFFSPTLVLSTRTIVHICTYTYRCHVGRVRNQNAMPLWVEIPSRRQGGMAFHLCCPDCFW